MNANDHDGTENSDDDDKNDTALSEDLRRALQSAVIGICEKEDDDDMNGSSMSGSAIKTLTELTYLYATTSLARDLSAFAAHAGRQTIIASDVKLVARKNPDIQEKLEQYCKEHIKRKEPKKRTKKGDADTKKKVDKKERASSNDNNDDSSNNSSSSSSEESESNLDRIKNAAKPAARKRSRPRDEAAAKPLAMSSDSSSTEDSLIRASRKKKTAIKDTIELSDSSSSSSSSEDEKETQARKRTSASDMLKVLQASATHLSDSDED